MSDKKHYAIVLCCYQKDEAQELAKALVTLNSRFKMHMIMYEFDDLFKNGMHGKIKYEDFVNEET